DSRGLILVRDPRDGEKRIEHRVAPPPKRAYRVALAPDGRRVAFALEFEGANVAVVEVASGRELGRMPWDKTVLAALGFARDGRLAVLGMQGEILIWDPASDRPPESLQMGHSGMPTAVAFSLDGRRLAVGSYERQIEIWDLGSRVKRNTLQGHTEMVGALAFLPDG